MSYGPAFKTLAFVRKHLVFFIPWLVLCIYWLTIFIATHTPAAKLPAIKVTGNDKTMHYLAYLGLGIFFWLAYYREKRPTFKEKKTWTVVLMLIGYGVLDEATQWFVGRNVSALDLLFDSLGILSSLLILFLVRKLLHWLIIIWIIFFVFTHWPLQTAFITMPDNFTPLLDITYMVCYCLITMMLWRCLSPKSKFMINRYIFIWTVIIMMSYLICDQFILTVLMRKDFNQNTLNTAIASIVVGIIASFLFGLQNQAEENYQKQLKYLEENNIPDPNFYDPGY